LDFFNEIGGLNFNNNNSSAPKELQAPANDMFNFGGQGTSDILSTASAQAVLQPSSDPFSG
jgi:hypothetical protein